MSFNKKKTILNNDDGKGDTLPFKNKKTALNIKPQNDIKIQQQKREEIQKRLNLLKQNTLKIVSKNVKNAKKKMQAKDPVLQNQRKTIPKTSEKKIKTPSPVLENQKKTTPKSSETPSSSVIEKIGILRETSLTNNSESLYTSMQTSFTEKLSELINIESEYQLKVPETRLRTPIKEYLKNNNENTPFWLKPSSVQSYPYNFIMAVRKKLESLSHPIQGPTIQKSVDDFPEVIQKKLSISDVNTNFSSISLSVQDSNTISDVSSIQSEIIRNVENVERDENNIHSPLSVEKINNLRIQSDFIELNRRKSFGNEKEEPQQDFQKIFEAFNEKLSQCIEVNKQLYSSFHNPQRTKEISKKLNKKEFCDSDGEKEKDLENKENSRSLMGNEILSVFNQFDLNNTVNTSESNLSYSNIGMYDQLIQSETSKSEHLTTIKNKREKYLIDWTKGQISWLELQRQKCKENGELSKIKAIKKKQRALLMKLENEKSQNELSKTHERHQKTLKMVPFDDLDSSRILAKITKKNYTPSSTGALKVFEPNHSNLHLERILRDRETQLQKRREQVQNLIKWHQRLDNEEDELILMEKGLEKYNLHKNVLTVEFYPNQTPEISDITHLIVRDQKRFNKIENSLKVLLNISSVELNDHFVEASGIKMNRLWKRLTGENCLKFNPTISYNLSKTDLENLYEEAKVFVAKQFDDHKNLKTLLENSVIRSDSDVTVKSVKIQSNTGDIPTIDEQNSIQYSSDFISQTNNLEESLTEKTELQAENMQVIELENSENSLKIDNTLEEVLMTEEPLSATEESKELEETPEISEIPDEPLIASTIDEITSLSNYSYTESPEDDQNSIKISEVEEEVENKTNTEETISETIQESVDLEKRLISLDDCLKDLNTTFDALNSQENSTEIKSPENILTELVDSTNSSSSTIQSAVDEKILDNFRVEVKIKKKTDVVEAVVPTVEYKIPSMSAGMPDIINEAEVLRRSLEIEQEIQRLEQLQAPAAIFLREIPNKPPPPYVFPTVCPAENKISEIIEIQVKSLYENKVIQSLESTSIYERVISDVCKEVYNEFNSPSNKLNQNYLNKLSLYNPPDHLKAMQLHILEKIKQLLLFNTNNKIDGPSTVIIGGGGKKRDQVDEILIREMFENNSNWTNFDLEELEVKHNIFNDVKNLMFAETTEK